MDGIRFNPFMIVVGALQIAGGLYSIWQRDWKMGLVYVLFGLSSGILATVKA